MALAGALALAAFAGTAGTVFFGEARSPEAEGARESGIAMLVPMAVLGFICLISAFSAPFLSELVGPVAGAFSGTGLDLSELLDAAGILFDAVLVGLFAVWLFLGLMLMRRMFSPASSGARVPTWDCGYAKPAPSMQYCFASFARPLTLFLGGILGLKSKGPDKDGFSTCSSDLAGRMVLGPLFRSVSYLCVRPRQLIQHGRIQLYILYMALALIGLLIWNMARNHQ